MKSKIDALIIAYWFPPASNQTWRSYHLFRAIQNHFHSIKIVSTSNRKYLPLKDYQDTNKFIAKALTIDYRLFTYFNRREVKHVDERFKPKWAFKIYNIFNSFPFNLLIGEGGFIYIISGFLKGLKLIEKNQQIFLFSTYRPYADHAIAYLIKLARPNCFWVADFRDLHIDPRLKEYVFPKFQVWCNKKILAKADIVTTVSKGLAIHLHDIHPNIVVLRNGIAADFTLLSTKKNSISNNQKDSFCITYTGSMFRDLRKPDLLLLALKELITEVKIDPTKLKIKYAGKDKATWMPLLERYGLVGNFEALGNIAYEDSLQIQSVSHINLLLTYASPDLKGNATGKLYEYLAARRPILLLVNGCKDEELEEIFESTNAGLVAYDSLNQTELVKQFIMEKYTEWSKTGQVAPSISPEQLTAFKWDYMIKKFLDKYYLNKMPQRV